MSVSPDLITRWQHLQTALTEAAHHAGRDPATVTLLAVSKQHPASALRALADVGQRHFGESYLQEALPKQEQLRAWPLVWHFIGQLQSNKTRAVAEHFDWVHTVDRDKIATRLHEQRPHYGAPLQVCIQVKLADEPGKGGIAPEQVPTLAAHIRQLPRLQLRGLMCIPPPVPTPSQQLAQFQQLATLQMQLNAQGFALDTLSMGMSDDFPAAIAAGATLIRIGTALFGPRGEA